MLIEDKNKWCWVNDFGDAGDPQDTIQEAIDDFMDYEPDLKEIWRTDETERVVRIGHPNYYAPEVNADRAWEKKHGYENTGYVVLETKSYPVDSKGNLIVV